MMLYRSHDNNRIVSAGADKIVQLVDVGTAQVVRKIRGHMAVSLILIIWCRIFIMFCRE